jgi:hypothetical protein
MPLSHERNGQNAKAQNCPQDNFVFHPEERPLIKQNIAQGTATKGRQKTPTTSMRLRAASMMPDKANAKVASNSMVGNRVEPQVSKLFIISRL